TILSQDVMMRHTESRQGSAARHRANRRYVLSREDGRHAGKSQRGSCIDTPHLRGGGWTSHDTRVMHARLLNVVHIGGGAGDEAWVFTPADTLSNQLPSSLGREYGRHAMF